MSFLIFLIITIPVVKAKVEISDGFVIAIAILSAASAICTRCGK